MWTHLIAYSTKLYICILKGNHVYGMNYSKHDAFLSFQDNILCFCFTTTTTIQKLVRNSEFAKNQTLLNLKIKRLPKLLVEHTVFRTTVRFVLPLPTYEFYTWNTVRLCALCKGFFFYFLLCHSFLMSLLPYKIIIIA